MLIVFLNLYRLKYVEVIINENLLGLGSNEGSRLNNLLLGCESIKGLPDTSLINISNVYETPPLYNEKLSNFLQYGH